MSAKPGSCATCVASSPSVRDLVCGRQSSFPLGTRSSMRRVVAISDSRSGKSTANGDSEGGVLERFPGRLDDRFAGALEMRLAERFDDEDFFGMVVSLNGM